MLTILTGDAIDQLRTLPDESVHCCVTSPPYWGLRDYSTNGQIGLEKTPEEYVAKMVEVFREVRRVLRKDGTLWLNFGDSYWGDSPPRKKSSEAFSETWDKANTASNGGLRRTAARHGALKAKDLCGIPWRVAFALQADGWWLRSDIIWAKPNPMPESVTDRPTKSHEYLFLLSKSANYFYDAEAIKEKTLPQSIERSKYAYNAMGGPNGEYGAKISQGGATKMVELEANRNKRSVWTVATAPYPEAHFATYPPDLIKPCILAGTSAKGCCAKCGSPWERIVEKSGGTIGQSWHNHEDDLGRGQRGGDNSNVAADAWARGDYKVETKGWIQICRCGLERGALGYPPETVPCTVLDPFAGSGTTGAVALELGRKAILIELNPKYVALIRQRCDVTPGLALA